MGKITLKSRSDGNGFFVDLGMPPPGKDFVLE
jgi:hypothetical protein